MSVRQSPMGRHLLSSSVTEEHGSDFYTWSIRYCLGAEIRSNCRLMSSLQSRTRKSPGGSDCEKISQAPAAFAEGFFSRLSKARVKKLIDVRLNNVSQLAGFAKKADLKFFTKAICNSGYEHLPELAPTQVMLDEYKKSKGSWSVYAEKFLNLMAQRKIETIDRSRLDEGCLLCSEDKPHHCHRRLVAEYLKDKWGDVEIEHL